MQYYNFVVFLALQKSQKSQGAVQFIGRDSVHLFLVCSAFFCVSHESFILSLATYGIVLIVKDMSINDVLVVIQKGRA